ncbi:MAG: oligosaccharide flippase family protein [Candidatus Moranbacteria bacterium]|nr:oligosaccharide flippase family protein [Candidatus Moranbacteria bacterium]
MLKKIRNNAFAWNSFVLFSGSMVNNVLNYIFHLVVGRMVSVAVYGETESLISLMTIISVPAATLIMVMTKYAAECKAQDNKKRSYELLSYFNKKITQYGTPVFLLTILLTPFISKFLNIESNIPLVIVWVSMLLSLYSSGAQGMLSGWQKFKESSWAAIAGGALKLVSALVFIAVGLKVNGLMLSFFLSAVGTYVIALICLKFIIVTGKNDTHEIAKLNFGSVKSTVATFFMGNLAITALGNLDMVLAKHNLSDIEAGQYGALTIVSKIIFFATGVIAGVLFSMSAEHNHKKESNSRKLFLQAFSLMIMVSVISVAVYFLAPRLILSLLFGAKYNAVSGYLGWFAILVVLFSLVNLTLQYLLSLHRVKVVYGLLSVAVIAAFAILFLGHTISAILSIGIIAQFVALISTLPFIFNSFNSASSSLKLHNDELG